jgi:hypothetical protein
MSKSLEYYLGLVTSEYQNSPNFLAWLQGFIEHISDATTVLESMDACFDIDTAIGAQLDILGVIIGQERQVNFQPTNGGSPILNDDNYRILLKAKILKNQWNGLNQSIAELWKILLPKTTILVQDNLDMTENVYIGGNLNQTIRDLIRNGYIVPKPQGVRINYFYFGGAPFFGFDLDNGYIAGFDKGSWVHDNDPKTFGFDLDNSIVSGFDTGTWSD